MMKQKQGTEARMSTEYYLIRKNAVPEVLQKVVEVNKLLESGQSERSEKRLPESASAGVLIINSKMIFRNFTTASPVKH